MYMTMYDDNGNQLYEGEFRGDIQDLREKEQEESLIVTNILSTMDSG